MSGRVVRWLGLGCAAPGLLTVWLPDALLESWVGPVYVLWLFASGSAAWAALEAIRDRKESGTRRGAGVGRGPWWGLMAGTIVVSIAIGATEAEGGIVLCGMGLGGTVCLGALWALGWRAEQPRGREG